MTEWVSACSRPDSTIQHTISSNTHSSDTSCQSSYRAKHVNRADELPRCITLSGKHLVEVETLHLRRIHSRTARIAQPAFADLIEWIPPAVDIWAISSRNSRNNPGNATSCNQREHQGLPIAMRLLTILDPLLESADAETGSHCTDQARVM